MMHKIVNELMAPDHIDVYLKNKKTRTKQKAPVGYRPKTLWKLSQWIRNL